MKTPCIFNIYSIISEFYLLTDLVLMVLLKSHVISYGTELTNQIMFSICIATFVIITAIYYVSKKIKMKEIRYTLMIFNLMFILFMFYYLLSWVEWGNG